MVRITIPAVLLAASISAFAHAPVVCAQSYARPLPYCADGMTFNYATGACEASAFGRPKAYVYRRGCHCGVPRSAYALHATRIAERVPEEMKRSVRRQAVLGRTASADDIAQMVVTFCRAESVTGQTVVVDGGTPAGMH
jgi:NAD(P)-dependent dehydrogenase (short-subunit alcohol dehydrogenase family)